MSLGIVVASALLLAQTADEPRAPYRVRGAVDGGIALAALAGAGALTLVRVQPGPPWARELLAVDERVKARFSRGAAATSDALLLAAVAAPLVLQLTRGGDEWLAESAIVYGQGLAASALLNAIAKYTVQRPRPYTYNPDDSVRAYAAAQGADAYLSFYSGHASTAFAAAVGGSALFALRSSDERARAAVWGVGLGLATATANLRVRAGKHFYSDVLVGAVVGSAIALGTVTLHARSREALRPSALEWAAMAGGLATGVLASELAPFGSGNPDVTSAPAARVLAVPMVLDRGAGVMIALAW